MRTPLLLLAGLLLAQLSFAAGPAAFTRPAGMRDLSAAAIDHSMAHYEVGPHKPLYNRGKGTMGLVLGLLLGPLGYFGVHCFSHNRAQRRKASQGLKIWGAVLLFCGTIVLCAAVKANPPNWDFSSWDFSANDD